MTRDTMKGTTLVVMSVATGTGTTTVNTTIGATVCKAEATTKADATTTTFAKIARALATCKLGTKTGVLAADDFYHQKFTN